MNNRNKLTTAITETQHRLTVAKGKLTATISHKERADLVMEVSDCIGRLIELRERLLDDVNAEVPPRLSMEAPERVRERGWWVR